MHAGDHYWVGAGTPESRTTPLLSGQFNRQAAQPADEDRSARPAMRRGWAALAWAAGGMAVFVLFLGISLTAGVSSDAANNALQAWDMLHGHLLLHGWIIGDATYYTFELPLIAIVEIFFGLHTITMHVAMALIYLIVTACAVAIAVTGSRGASRATRAAVVVAVLAAPTLIFTDMWIPIGIPDHTGTTVFLLVSALLIDRAPARRFTAPLLCVILAAGQLGDVTVRYVAVPAIALVCAYQAAAARKILTGNTANLVAAVASVPLANAVRAVMRHFGAYLMVAPKTKVAPASQWQHNAALAWHSLRLVFGETAPANARVGTAAIFGAACLLVAGLGVLRVLWRWRTARPAEQVLLAAIAANLGVYVISTLPALNTPHDIVAVLPCGAVLGARALVPERIAGRLTALTASGAAAVTALLPLSLTAAQPTVYPAWSQLAPWLQAHGLRYGLGGYWDGSAVTLLTGNQVQVRTVKLSGHRLTYKPWETNTLWFEPSRYYANFLIIELSSHGHLGPAAARFFGKPASTYRIGKDWEVLIYSKNLLKEVKPAPLPPLN